MTAFDDRASRQFTLDTPVCCVPPDCCPDDCCKIVCTRYNSYRKWSVLFAIVFVYVMVGSAIFYLSESDNELEELASAISARTAAEAAFSNLLSSSASSEDASTASSLCTQLGTATQTAATRAVKNWDWPPAIFFVCSVITTVGNIS